MIDKDGKNVALNANGGEASQSSIYTSDRQPERGNDGVITSDDEDDSTNVQTNPELGRSDLI